LATRPKRYGLDNRELKAQDLIPRLLNKKQGVSRITPGTMHRIATLQKCQLAIGHRKLNGSRMDPQADPISMWITGGGGLGGGALGGYLISRLMQQQNKPIVDNNDLNKGLERIADRLDHTNELLNQLLRSHARLEGLLERGDR
jgi:hypothetical protein